MRATNNPRMIGRSHNISRSARKPEYTLEEQIDRAARNVRAMKNNLEMALANPHLTEYNRGMAMAALAEAEVKHKLLRKQLPAWRTEPAFIELRPSPINAEGLSCEANTGQPGEKGSDNGEYTPKSEITTP